MSEDPNKSLIEITSLEKGQWRCAMCGDIFFGEDCKKVRLGGTALIICTTCYNIFESTVIDHSPYQVNYFPRADDSRDISKLISEDQGEL